METPQRVSEKEREILLKAFPRGICAFDLETTGLSPLADAVVEIAACKLEPGGEVGLFSQLVAPGIPVPEESVRIHGIDDAALAGAPEPARVLPAFLEFTHGLPLIAHNARFDGGFLIFALHLAQLPPPPVDIFCSLQLARKGFPECMGYGLDVLARRLNIPLRHHRAGDDAMACLRIAAGALSSVPLIRPLYNLGNFRPEKLAGELPPSLRDLLVCAREGRAVEIKYKGGRRKGEFRPLLPLSLMPLPGGNVLYAHCKLSDTRKSFYLHKITALRRV